MLATEFAYISPGPRKDNPAVQINKVAFQFLSLKKLCLCGFPLRLVNLEGTNTTEFWGHLS